MAIKDALESHLNQDWIPEIDPGTQIWVYIEDFTPILAGKAVAERRVLWVDLTNN